MKPIGDPRHSQLLQREFLIRGPSVAPILESSIQPVAVVVNLDGRDEISETPQRRHCGLHTSVAGDATHPAQLGIINPAGSGCVLVLRRFANLFTVGANGIKAGFVPPASLSVSGLLPYFNNRRLQGNPIGTLIGSGTLAAVAIAPNNVTLTFPAAVTSLANSFVGFPLDYVLPPGGDAFMVQTNDNNVSLYVGWQWEEVQIIT